MLNNKPTWIKLVVVCFFCLLIIAGIGLIIQHFI